MRQKWKIGVIGAGPGGLSAAYELQKYGFDVTVFEAADHVGGRMSTRVKDGLAFDKGANFFVAKYRNTAAYCQELGMDEAWKQTVGNGEHYTIKDDKLCSLTFNSLRSIFKFDALPRWQQAKLAIMFFNAKRKYGGLNFFDLGSLPSKLNSTNAYDYIEERIGKESADYIVDAFTSMYQFHSAKEMSIAAMFALMGMMTNDINGFTRYHVFPGQMSMIPEALAAKLNIKLSYPINKIEGVNDKVTVYGNDEIYEFDKVVIATTADVAKKIYTNPGVRHYNFLADVQYASTINVSFKIPAEFLEGIACVAVPYRVNSVISEYTNESLKGILLGDKTLINIGLHEESAKVLMSKTDEEIFDRVRSEIVRLPPLKGCNVNFLENHDLQRWPAAMPKFSRYFVSQCSSFWEYGQGENSIYLAGDMTGCPWVEGAITSGKKVANMIYEKFHGPTFIFIR